MSIDCPYTSLMIGCDLNIPSQHLGDEVVDEVLAVSPVSSTLDGVALADETSTGWGKLEGPEECGNEGNRGGEMLIASKWAFKQVLFKVCYVHRISLDVLPRESRSSILIYNEEQDLSNTMSIEIISSMLGNHNRGFSRKQTLTCLGFGLRIRSFI